MLPTGRLALFGRFLPKRVVIVACGLVALSSLFAIKTATATASPTRWAVLTYDGIGTEAGGLVLGRVVEDRGLDEPKLAESTLHKMARLRRMLDSHPLVGAHVVVRVAGRRQNQVTDKRGFFSWRIPGPLTVGDHRVDVELLGGAHVRAIGHGQLSIYPRRPGVLWVSDIDDTVLKTGVRHKLHMIKGLFTHNALELQSYADAPELLRAGRAAGYALAYVSGSPWQLQPRLRRFMAHRGLPRAALFLKRIGLGDDADALFDQGAYKRRQLERLLTLLPGYRLVCFGDSGEHDPEIYRALKRRHPKRVLAVLIHDVGTLRAHDPRVAGQVRFKGWATAQRWLVGAGLLRRSALKVRKTKVSAGH